MQNKTRLMNRESYLVQKDQQVTQECFNQRKRDNNLI